MKVKLKIKKKGIYQKNIDIQKKNGPNIYVLEKQQDLNNLEVNNMNYNIISEVKGKTFKIDIPVEKQVLYDGFKFIQDNHQPKNPNILN